ncbi:MAG: glycosyltransferase family 4 protein [Candidatus Sungbacteria bacterium]|nr:glycosyltransferase family 4 protein [Candidatus Sungbacteria bacterium]
MKVLVIGNDPQIFDKNSETHMRVCAYADFFDSYHIISKTLRRVAPFNVGKLYLWPINFRYKLGWPLGAILLGKKIAREQKIDIIDAQDPAESGFAAWFISYLTGKPFRLQIHTDIMSPWYRRASWKEWMRYGLAKFLIPRADCIRVVSERIRKSILDSRFMIHDSRIAVLPIFTDVSKFLSAERNSEIDERFREYDFKMIAVGRFVDKEKNFSMLIEIMRDFIKICPRALLVIVGDGPDRDRYKLQATNYKLLDRNIIIEPWRNDLPSFLKSFDLCVMPSNYEGWGRTAIEAMAAGLAVVMTDVGLAGEVVKNGENGRVAPVGDKNAFLRAIIGLYKNRAERMRLASAARKTAEGLSAQSKSDYFNLYRDALYEC